MPRKLPAADPSKVPWEATYAADLQRRREALGLSQSELARRAKDLGLPIHQTTVARIENGTRAVNLNEALALAKIVGADPLEMASFNTANSSEADLALLATRTARNVARASFAAVGDAWQRMDDAEQNARVWLLKAVVAAGGRVDDTYDALAEPLDAVRAMARALEKFLDEYSDDNMEPLIGPDPEA